MEGGGSVSSTAAGNIIIVGLFWRRSCCHFAQWRLDRLLRMTPQSTTIMTYSQHHYTIHLCSYWDGMGGGGVSSTAAGNIIIDATDGNTTAFNTTISHDTYSRSTPLTTLTALVSGGK